MYYKYEFSTIIYTIEKKSKLPFCNPDKCSEKKSLVKYSINVTRHLSIMIFQYV